MIGKCRYTLDWNMDKMTNRLENIELTEIYFRRDKKPKQTNNYRRNWDCNIPSSPGPDGFSSK